MLKLWRLEGLTYFRRWTTLRPEEPHDTAANEGQVRSGPVHSFGIRFGVRTAAVSLP